MKNTYLLVFGLITYKEREERRGGEGENKQWRQEGENMFSSLLAAFEMVG